MDRGYFNCSCCMQFTFLLVLLTICELPASSVTSILSLSPELLPSVAACALDHPSWIACDFNHFFLELLRSCIVFTAVTPSIPCIPFTHPARPLPPSIECRLRRTAAPQSCLHQVAHHRLSVHRSSSSCVWTHPPNFSTHLTTFRVCSPRCWSWWRPQRWRHWWWIHPSVAVVTENGSDLVNCFLTGG